MKTLIIYAHPYEKSFNFSILSRVIQTLEKEKKDFEIIDLYKEQFNPIYTNEELKLFSEGKTTDALVNKYQQMIKESHELIFIFPIWWNDLPSIVKGFFDKVMKKCFAYEDTKTGVHGLLDHIESAKIITTSSSPTWYLKLFAGNAIQSVLIDATLKQIGVKKSKWINCGNINKIDNTKREKFLKNL